MKHTCKLIDDDGVLVISTTRQMEYWKDQKFDYGFPREVLGHMREFRIIAWQSGWEGKCAIVVTFPSTPPLPARGIGPFSLSALEKDQFIIMPYSQFTFATARKAGVVWDMEGMSYRFEIPQGHYHIYISKSSNRCLVDICPADGTPLFTLSNQLPALCRDRASHLVQPTR